MPKTTSIYRIRISSIYLQAVIERSYPWPVIALHTPKPLRITLPKSTKIPSVYLHSHKVMDGPVGQHTHWDTSKTMTDR